VVSQTTVSRQATPRGGGCDIEIPVCRVVRQPDEAFSTHTTLRKCGATSQIGCRRRATPHALELDRSTPEDYERLKLLGACLTQQGAGSNRAFRGTTPDLTVTAVRHFLHWPSRTLSWASSHADLCWYPLQPTRTNGRCMLWLLRPAADVARMTQ
jgi:hypothetical protein